MPTNYKVLGQVNPTALTNTTLYTVPAATQAVISTITISNANTTANANYGIAIRPAGETIAAKHYITNNNVVQSLDSIGLTLGLTLGNTDVVTVYASHSNVSFGIFGSEVT
jgi:guanyl-specific ribonuclease Sa